MNTTLTLEVLPASVRHFLQALAHQLADRHVVERHVVRRTAAQCEPVVVDRLDAGVLGLLEAGAAGLRVQVDDEQDADASVDHAVAQRRELGFVAVGVLDVGLDAGGVECLFEQRSVVGLPPRRRRRVGQDHADLAGLLAARSTRVVFLAAAPGERKRHRRYAGDDARNAVAHSLDSSPADVR
jgi:hypothetical protein